MNVWFTRAGAPIVQTHVKRFDPLHWTVDFPRGSIASIVTAEDGHGLTVRAEFLGKGDLVGLIWESEDRHAHPAHARETSSDYSRCVLSFHWESAGVIALDAINGPTLTIEGKDEAGEPRAWLVRLWNYAKGSPTSADIEIDFDALDGGFVLPGDAVRVDARRIDRMFVSLVAPGYASGSEERFAAPVAGSVSMTNIRCDGSGSVLAINDAVVPEHELRIATAYDDMYNLPPERVVQAAERLGYRRLINHYVGMSHHFALDGAGKLDPARTMNSAALAWHRDFARAAKARGYEVIWSISYEILDMFCPDAWKQRAFDGSPALTGWDPPSALVSPANEDAIGFLQTVAAQLVAISVEAGLQPQVQIGEPWWWVNPGGEICLYDDAAKAALGGDPVAINWSQARLRFDAGPGVRGDAELETLLGFFRARRGPAVGFRFRDPYDNSSNGMTGMPSAEDQLIGAGDGLSTRFELVKSYGSGEVRRITRPTPGSVRVAVDGVELATGWVLGQKGSIEFAQAPAAGTEIRAGFLFDTPVRFAEDRLEINRATFLAGEAPSVPLVEVREA